MQKKQEIHGVEDNIQRAEQNIDKDEETVLENIDDDIYNDKQEDSSEEILLQKAAKRCKITLESFKKEYERAKGKDIYEKIQNAEDTINLDFMGGNRR